MKPHTLVGALLAGIGSVASAEGFTEAVFNELRREGFDYVEVHLGPRQVRFEALRADRRLEAVYDRATGELVKREEYHAAGTRRRDGILSVHCTRADFVPLAAADGLASVVEDGYTVWRHDDGRRDDDRYDDSRYDDDRYDDDRYGDDDDD